MILASRVFCLLSINEKIEAITGKLEEVRESTKNLPLPESLPSRVRAIGDFYANPGWINRKLLGGLEIFEGTTAKNIKCNPMVSLLFTGQAPKYPSFQFNGIMEIVKPGNKYYQFLLAARELFAMDAFHIHQIRYPFGYLFHLVEIKDKTPYPKR